MYAEELKQMRLALGVSESEVANCFGVSADQIRSWETGAPMPFDAVNILLTLQRASAPARPRR